MSIDGNDNGHHEEPGSSPKSIPWDEFFNQMDQKFPTTTEETVQIIVDNHEIFPNVATLPHKSKFLLKRDKF